MRTKGQKAKIVNCFKTFNIVQMKLIFTYYTPTTKCGGGGYTGFALSRRSVGRSVRLQFLSAL